MRSALAFLTPLPVGTAPPGPTTLLWFSAAGALIGALVGGVWWAAGEAFTPLVAAGVAVVADVILTGALHMDGVADSADGLLPPLDGPERRKAVMATPDIGAFGVAAVAAVVLLRWSALASMAPDVLLVASLWAASRAVMAVLLVALPYVGGGLASSFLADRPLLVLQASVTLPLGLALINTDMTAPGLAALAAAGLAAAGVALLARRRVGGVTGDVLGAAGVIAETVGLVVASARW